MDFDILGYRRNDLALLCTYPQTKATSKMAVPTAGAKIFYTPDFPAREVFEHLAWFLARRIQLKVLRGCNNKSCIENEELIPYFLLFPAYCFSPTPGGL